MNVLVSKATKFTFAGLVLMISACTTLYVKTPTESAGGTILVLPVEVIKNVVAEFHSFYYVYTISRVDNDSFSHEVDIKFPVQRDIVLVDTLPPGDYYLSRFTFLPIGSGDITYGNNSRQMYTRFSLESGKITIFPKKLQVFMRNLNPGRVGEIVYNFDIVALPFDERKTVLATLGEQKNFGLWEVQGSSAGASLGKQSSTSARPLPAADGKWKGTWWPLTQTGEHGIECKGGDMVVEVTEREMNGQVTTDDGFQFEFYGTQFHDGDIRGRLHYGKKYYARVTGKVSNKAEIKGELLFDNDCKSGWTLSSLDSTVMNTEAEVPDKTFTGVNVAGTYKARLAPGPDYFFGKRTADVRIEQDGNQVSGTIGDNLATFSGIVEGDTVSLDWKSVRYSGTAELRIRTGAKELEGSWRARSGSGDWELKKIE